MEKSEIHKKIVANMGDMFDSLNKKLLEIDFESEIPLDIELKALIDAATFVQDLTAHIDMRMKGDEPLPQIVCVVSALEILKKLCADTIDCYEDYSEEEEEENIS